MEPKIIEILRNHSVKTMHSFVLQGMKFENAARDIAGIYSNSYPAAFIIYLLEQKFYIDPKTNLFTRKAGFATKITYHTLVGPYMEWLKYTTKKEVDKTWQSPRHTTVS